MRFRSRLLSKRMRGDLKRTITQRDIAVRAGVTQMTVSLALRGSAEVSAATVARIRALAEEMGYAPNPRGEQRL
jgi:DNA-binding LacI/PurR family transcriptional regulator